MFPKKYLFIVLPYLGMSSLYLRTCLQKSIDSNMLFCEITIIFKPSTWLANFFSFKKIPLCLCSHIVYKFASGRCIATYYNETCCYFKVTVGEDSGISPLLKKQPKSKKVTAVKHHMLLCNNWKFVVYVCFIEFPYKKKSVFWSVKPICNNIVLFLTEQICLCRSKISFWIVEDSFSRIMKL